MFGYKLLKLATFFLYWLGFAPWLVLILRKEELINASSLQDVFLQYTTVLFILILIYLIIHQVFEHFYLRHKIKKTVRKVTVRHQLRRLERGEIDLKAAQRVSTFTKLKQPETPHLKKQLVKGSKMELKNETNKDVAKESKRPETKNDLKEPEKRVIKDLTVEEETGEKYKIDKENQVDAIEKSS